MQFVILFAMQVLIGLFVVILLRKTMQIRKQVTHVVKEVEGYIAFITEETEEDEQVRDVVGLQYKREEGVYQNEQRKKKSELSKDDAQTQLIQAVLGEYFP